MRINEKRRDRMRNIESVFIFTLVFSLTYKIWYLFSFKTSQIHSNPSFPRARDVWFFLPLPNTIGCVLNKPYIC